MTAYPVVHAGPPLPDGTPRKLVRLNPDNPAVARWFAVLLAQLLPMPPAALLAQGDVQTGEFSMPLTEDLLPALQILRLTVTRLQRDWPATPDVQPAAPDGVVPDAGGVGAALIHWPLLIWAAPPAPDGTARKLVCFDPMQVEVVHWLTVLLGALVESQGATTLRHESSNKLFEFYLLSTPELEQALQMLRSIVARLQEVAVPEVLAARAPAER